MMRKLNILVKRLVLWLNHTPLHICTLIVCSGVVIKAWVLFQNWVIWNFCCIANLSFLFHCDKFFFDLYFWFHFRNIFEYFRFSALIKNCVSLTLSFISCHIVPVLKKNALCLFPLYSLFLNQLPYLCNCTRQRTAAKSYHPASGRVRLSDCQIVPTNYLSDFWESSGGFLHWKVGATDLFKSQCYRPTDCCP